MIHSRRYLSRQQTEVPDVEAVANFAYLGTELTRESEQEVEIQKRIMSANKVNSCLLAIIKSRLVHSKDKLRKCKNNPTSSKIWIRRMDDDNHKKGEQ
jgi:hypothetical protein